MLSRRLILCVRGYQVALGPLIGPCCRFTPSCSEYCIGARRAHGAGCRVGGHDARCAAL
jgi:putative component of membrane protein insertase Oxa1/YidC/SpoIIIJ protein YidD